MGESSLEDSSGGMQSFTRIGGQQQPLLQERSEVLFSSEVKTEEGTGRGGNPVKYGCSLSSMSYMTFAMISIYTMINVNNNVNNNNNNNNNNENTNANMKRKRKRRSLKATEEAMKAARDDDKGLVEHLIERPLTDAA